ncbi:MAG: hypothetical protein JSR82_24495 [Verrucomicrobia bacterium]|nr:hypothetical protein [Verrucomicrobiota bacterium]
MNHGEALAPAKTPEEIRRARVVVLLDRYEKGERLPAADLELVEAELARLAPGSGAAPADTFELRADLPGPSTYRPYKEYAVTYEVSDRSIKAWVARGRDAKDWPPLNEPHKMADWYARVLNAKIPPRLVALAEKGGGAAPAPAGEGATAQPAAGIDISAMVGQSVEQQIEGLRQAVAACFQGLCEAYKSSRPETIATRESAYQRAIATLQKLESQQEEMRRKRGDYILKSDVDADAATLANALRSMHRSMVERVRAALTDLDPAIVDRVAAAVEDVRRSEEALFRAPHTLPFPSPDVAHVRAA